MTAVVVFLKIKITQTHKLHLHLMPVFELDL
jgi:hypothetical protein